MIFNIFFNGISVCIILHNLLLASDTWEATEKELTQVLEKEIEKEEEYNMNKAERKL